MAGPSKDIAAVSRSRKASLASTIGAEGLNFRVRDGTGCFPLGQPFLRNQGIYLHKEAFQILPAPPGRGRKHRWDLPFRP